MQYRPTKIKYVEKEPSELSYYKGGRCLHGRHSGAQLGFLKVK